MKEKLNIYRIRKRVLLSVLFLCLQSNSVIALSDFTVGERMEFAITYQGILVGHGYLEVNGNELYNGHEVYHLVSCAQTEDFFSSFFYLKDRVDTLIDVETLDTVFFEKTAHEGNNYEHMKVIYNQEESLAWVDDECYRIVSQSRDILGAFYYFRTIPLSVGDELTIPIFQGERNTSLYIDVLNTETVDTHAGTFNTLVLQGDLEGSDGLFTGSSEFKLWLTDDENRYVVRIQTKIIIGTITVDLVAIEK